MDCESLEKQEAIDTECRKSAVNTALFWRRATKKIGYKGSAKFGKYKVSIEALGVAVYRGRDLFRFFEDR